MAVWEGLWVPERQRWSIVPDFSVFEIAWDGGDRLAIAGSGQVQILDLPHGGTVARWAAHHGNINAIRWSPDGLLASAAYDGTVCFWREGRDNAVAVFDAGDAVNDIAFSPDGKLLLAVCENGAARMREMSGILAGRAASLPRSNDYIARQAITVGCYIAPTRSRVREVTAAQTLEGGNRSVFPRAMFFPDGHLLTLHDRVMRRWDTARGEIEWEVPLTGEVAISNPDTLVVKSSSSVVFLDSHTGVAVEERDISPGKRIGRSSGGRLITWGDREGGIEVYDTGDRPLQRFGTGGAAAELLAVPSGRSVTIYAIENGTEVLQIRSSEDRRLWDVRWSPDGRRIAAYGGTRLRIWDLDAPSAPPLELPHDGMLNGIGWSPDGMSIAGISSEEWLIVWDATSGTELLRFETPNGTHRSVGWSPDGSMMVTCARGDRIHLWNVAAAPEIAFQRAGRADTTPVRRILPSALAQLHRVGVYPPLSLLLDLLELTGGVETGESLAPVASSRGMRELAALRWPAAARVGLAALLLHDVALDGWQPPDDLTPQQVRNALALAMLTGKQVEPEPPPRPLEALLDAANRIDDRIISLLEILGADAVARDPGLPLRALPRLGQLRPLHLAQRQRLGLRTPLGTGGRATGSGIGGERGGFDLRGDLRALLPTQLALPDDVLRFRHLRGELLYRAKLGQEPPQLRPAVIVLDVSPAGLGPIERMTRIAAHILGSTLLEARMPSVLVLAGGSEVVRVLERTDDLIDLWTYRSHEPADCARTLRIARGMREQIAGDGVDPIILVLTHVWFGAEDDIPATPGLRGLFVQYPRQHVRPALASRCDQWESLSAADLDRLPSTLGALIR